MSYEACEAALLSQIREIDGFDETNTSLGDYNILNMGVERFAVLNYRGFTRQQWTAGGPVQYGWEIHILIGAVYTDDVTVHDTLREIRDGIITRVQQYPQLGDADTVFDSEVNGGGAVGLSDTNQPFMLEEMVCLVLENNQTQIA